ncbi:hypothetical protein KIN20_017475 [Parelaphostrongylus tenuis]|uniref:Uncharacterized protein n=1 Tax=Parelaphostrongylus tenuis TaxID=148309 RepID=A0AAD5MNB4_PARTN|nr:hypothetical protein KIN20_017475 [Parelaphostrongylus tenuis]
MVQANENRTALRYFDGLTSASAACCTHPPDLLKVHLQTQQFGRISLGQIAVKLYEVMASFRSRTRPSIDI